MNTPELPYADRRDAGRVLSHRLAHYAGRKDVLVLALPRGGVPVAYEVARSLAVPLDVFVVRKLGYPGHEEYAMGAIASGGVRVMNDEAAMPVSPREVELAIAREQAELARRERLYRDERPPPELSGRTVIVVDDGLATGSTMRAAVAALRRHRPARIAVAVPVGAAQTAALLAREADEVICAATPEPFRAVGLWYRKFPQTSDDEVRELLAKAEQEHTPTARAPLAGRLDEAA